MGRMKTFALWVAMKVFSEDLPNNDEIWEDAKAEWGIPDTEKAKAWFLGQVEYVRQHPNLFILEE